MIECGLAWCSDWTSRWVRRRLDGVARRVTPERRVVVSVNRRPFPLELDEAARRVWLEAFHRVLDSAPARYGFPEVHLEGFRAFLDGFSSWMVNVAPDGTAPA